MTKSLTMLKECVFGLNELCKCFDICLSGPCDDGNGLSYSTLPIKTQQRKTTTKRSITRKQGQKLPISDISAKFLEGLHM